MQRTDLHLIVDRVISFVRPMAEEKGVTISASLSPGPMVKDVDEDMIYRVFLNIVINGIHATEAGGAVEVKTATGTDGQAIISLSDTGVGMSEELASQIFQPFFTDKRKGTGLGLAIARNSVECHHGDIFVESREGHGSTFTVVLP